MTIAHFLAYSTGSLRAFAFSDHSAWNPILSALHGASSLLSFQFLLNVTMRERCSMTSLFK